jgi:hypothetical protein
MEMCGAKMRQLWAIEQNLSAVCKQIRDLLASPASTSEHQLELQRIFGKLDKHQIERQATTTTASASGFIYCIEDQTSHYYKIGKTQHKPATRLGTLQCGTPHSLFLQFAIKVRDTNKAERDIHHQLRHHRLRGEWFTCPLEQIYAAFKGADIEFWSDLHGNEVFMGGPLADLGCYEHRES